MASTNDVVFPESMADILANPVNICFGSMPATSTTPAACFVIESNTVTADQQIEADLLTETHPPTPSNLIAGINRVEGMLFDTIKVCECVKHPRVTSSTSSMPLGLRYAARLAFQVTHTTISPNYLGEELETLDRQILVVSADVPPQDGEIIEQRQGCENANAARAVWRQQEIAAATPGAGQQPANARQVNDNAGQQAPAAPAAPPQRRHDDPPRANRLRARDLLRDFERDGLEVYNSPQTNLGAALAALNHLEDSPAVRRLQANVRVVAAHIEERGPGYNRSTTSSYLRTMCGSMTGGWSLPCVMSD
jgi:hypothetical protein